MSEKPIWERRVDRKGFIAISAATAFLAACGGSSDDDEGSAAGDAELSGQLFYYNWADYVNPETYKDYTTETGVKIKKDFYVSNEDMLAKMQAGARGFDLVVPTGYAVKIMADQDLAQEIDWDKLPNVEANINPKFQGLPFDPDDKYSVPKDWGTTGFVYRTDKVKERPTTWREFVDLAKGPYSGKVTVLDGSPEVIGSMAVMLGHSYNTEDEAELEEAKKELLALKPHLLAITSTEYKQMLIAGKAVMGLGWNGDGAAVAAKKPAEYVIPEEGGEFWVDSYVIPVGAKNPNAAHAWIDFAYTPEINAQETSYTYYGSPVKRQKLQGVLDKTVLNNPDVFPPDDVLEKLEANDVSPKGTSLRERIGCFFRGG